MYFFQSTALTQESMAILNVNSLPSQIVVALISLITFFPMTQHQEPAWGTAGLYLIAYTGILISLEFLGNQHAYEQSILDGSHTISVARTVAIRALPLVLLTTVVLQSIQPFSFRLDVGITLILVGLLKMLRWICLFSLVCQIFALLSSILSYSSTALPFAVSYIYVTKLTILDGRDALGYHRPDLDLCCCIS
jgi:hypothetical protein